MKLRLPLFLIGFMGAGKTTLGKVLAERTGVPFIDTDTCIEELQGTTIANIFLERGEKTFRSIENQLLHDIIDSHQGCIISTGGGMPCHGSNVELMREAGGVVYIRLSVNSLANRLRSEADIRPLLVDRGKLTLEERIRELLAAREGYYERAHVAIDADGLDPRELSARLLPHISQWREGGV